MVKPDQQTSTLREMEALNARGTLERIQEQEAKTVDQPAPDTGRRTP